MRSRCVALAVFVAGLVLLRQAIVLVDQTAPRREQAAAVEAHGIDPRALFYAESRVALAAEKAFRRRLE